MEQQEAMLLWGEHYDDILSSARKYTKNPDTQAELVQEAFLYFIEGDKWEDIPNDDHDQFLKLARSTLRIMAMRYYDQKILSTHPREALMVHMGSADEHGNEVVEEDARATHADTGGFYTSTQGHYRTTLEGATVPMIMQTDLSDELGATELIDTIKWVIRSYPADKQLMIMDMVYGDTQKEVSEVHSIPQRTVNYWWNKFKIDLNEELKDA